MSECRKCEGHGAIDRKICDCLSGQMLARDAKHVAVAYNHETGKKDVFIDNDHAERKLRVCRVAFSAVQEHPSEGPTLMLGGLGIKFFPLHRLGGNSADVFNVVKELAQRLNYLRPQIAGALRSASDAELLEALKELRKLCDKATIPLVNSHAVRDMGKFIKACEAADLAIKHAEGKDA